jgi:rod shape-determining protein MreD
MISHHPTPNGVTHRAPPPMWLDVAKAALLLLFAAIVQVSFVNSFELAEGHADVVLLVLVGLGLLRGPIFGACAGFFAGLVLDTAILETLGLSSLLLTLAGYAAGRLGEATSSHQNARARIVIAITLLTLAVEVGSLIVHVLLGESADVGTILGRVLLPTLALNLILSIPAYALCRRLFPPRPRREREVVVG